MHGVPDNLYDALFGVKHINCCLNGKICHGTTNLDHNDRQLEDTRDKEAREHYMLKKQMEDEVEDSSKTNELLEALRSEKGELQKSTALLRERCSQAEAKCHQIEHEGQHLNSAVRDKDSQLSRLRDEIHQMQSKQVHLIPKMLLELTRAHSFSSFCEVVACGLGCSFSRQNEWGIFKACFDLQFCLLYGIPQNI